jgi:hypothetical protein
MKRTMTSFGMATLAGLGFAVLCLVLFNPEVSKLTGESEAAIAPSPIFYLPTLINVAPLAVPFTHDFETGDLTGWTRSDRDTASLFQPTFGDNPTARDDEGECIKNEAKFGANFACELDPSNHEGDWWFGGYEKYEGPNDPFLTTGKGKAQEPGDFQGSARSGHLTSIEFEVVGDKMNFLIGGRNYPWGRPDRPDLPAEDFEETWGDEGGPCNCVNLERGGHGKMQLTASGGIEDNHTQTMRRWEWDVSEFKGKTVTIVVYDRIHGYTNFDDIHQTRADGRELSWKQLLAVEAFGKLPTTFGEIKSNR